MDKDIFIGKYLIAFLLRKEKKQTILLSQVRRT